MGYWNEVKDIVTKGVDLAIDGIKEGAGKAVEKGKEGIAYAQLKKDLFLEGSKLKDHLADLGDRTRDLYKENKDIYADSKVKEIMDKVLHCENECKRLEQKLKEVSAAK